ncbi:tRNA-specific adenosine deaminase 1 [Helicoverpa zea]|uniref:tRNA-specific adenosine deaminase 1 n=1 Tax=Helicoverpa zea TaxID=7113 RepID=UPI001F590D76|nr:tRNA-specific adenosine deaminase 1 [Helicoverpa zea]
MHNLSDTLVEKVVQNCFNIYYKLPKNGKPIEKEWTVLSCFVQYDKSNERTEVVSLGSGSKCVGATKMVPNGSILNDSHAEVFARRGFLIYLYENVRKALNNKESIFNYDNGKLILKDNIEFIFYSSQLPCGDASIISQQGDQEHHGDVLNPQKRPADDDNCDIEVKKWKGDDYVLKTGAKCLPQCEQDVKDQGTNIQLHLGQVRTKPGRGDRTLSVSCSDKIAKWVHLGVQGSLLSMLCEPIYIKHFIFGAGVPYSKDSLHRALLNRPECSSLKLEVEPQFYQTSLVFSNISSENYTRPAPGSIVWVKTTNQLLEVAVQGRKLGVTVKKAISPACSLNISKYNLYKQFLKTLNTNEELKQKICGQEQIESIPYNKMKKKSTRYYEKWLDVKEKFFRTWTVKPDMWDFCVNLN